MIEALFNGNNYAASKTMLDATALRHEALAANIANIETPGYKRVDLAKNFAQEFSSQVRAGKGAQTAQPALAVDMDAPAQRLDGNDVEMDKELLAMSGNSMQYDALTEFVSNSLKQLRIAISGRTM